MNKVNYVVVEDMFWRWYASVKPYSAIMYDEDE